MAMRGRAVHKNHNPTLYIEELSPLNHVFIVVASSDHIFQERNSNEILFIDSRQ